MEREAEMGRFAEMVEWVARSGRGATLVVEGAPGIGKTRLLGAIREIAAAGGLDVLAARGAELERAFPFGLMRQLLGPPLAAAGAAERDQLLEGAATLALGALEGKPGDRSVDAAGVLHGLFWFVSALARRRPVLLAVDDAHWGDGASLRFMGYLLRRADSLPVFVAVATRPPAAGQADALVAGLTADPATEVVRPAALGAGAVDRLLVERLGGTPDPEFARACLATTGGNPFLLTELARELEAREVEPTATQAAQVSRLRPDNIARSLTVRLARAGDGARVLTPALAVLGDGADLSLAAELAGVPIEPAAAALDALVREGVLAHDLPPRFAHPLLRTAAEGLLAPGERSRLHGGAAAMLAGRGASAERVASHLLETDPAADAGTVEALAEAARLARERGAPDTAARLLRRALDEPPPTERRYQLLFDLGRDERELGLPSARDRLRAAAEARDPILAARATRALVWTHVADPRETTLPLVERAIDRVHEHDRELALGLEAMRLSTVWMIPDLTVGVERELARFRQLSGASPAESLALSFAAGLMMQQGEPAAAVEDVVERA
ncbi:MAG: AAA family ATPase, partial [Actinomycetota bacterium]|nr:AAA family ATPase [Actinomycetota bacterium]